MALHMPGRWLLFSREPLDLRKQQPVAGKAEQEAWKLKAAQAGSA
jgi:hypothetical protein